MKLINLFFISLFILGSFQMQGQWIAGEAEHIYNVNKGIKALVIYGLTSRKQQEFLNVDLNYDNEVDLKFEVIENFLDTFQVGVYLHILNPDIRFCDYLWLPNPIHYKKGENINDKCDSLSNERMIITEADFDAPEIINTIDTTYFGFTWQVDSTIHNGWVKLGYDLIFTKLRLYSIGCDTSLNINSELLTSNKDILLIKEKLILYPNPAYSIANLNIDKNNLKKIEIFSITGQVVKIIDSPSFSVTDLKSGIYYLMITKSDNKKYIKKLVVK